MAYSKTTWVDNTTPVNASNMNNIEDAVEELDTVRTWELIETQTLTSTPSTVTFNTNISNYRYLKLLANVKLSNEEEIEMTFNNDTSANYNWVRYVLSSVGGSHSGGTSQDYFYLQADQSFFVGMEVDIVNISSTRKTIRAWGLNDYQGVNWQHCGSWANASSSISEIDLSLSTYVFQTGSTFTLMGVK